MKKIMVCVTQQKTCDRLIKHGAEKLGSEKDELSVMHIAKEGYDFLGNHKEGEALEYLFQKSKEYGANLTVIRSTDVLKTLIEQSEKNEITDIVMGATGKKNQKNDIAMSLQEETSGKINIEIIASN